MEKRLERRLVSAGYRMLGDDRSVEGLISDILGSDNLRYWKAIPFLIYRYDPDLAHIYKKTDEKDKLIALLDITRRIFQEFDIKKTIPGFGKSDSIDRFLKKHKLDYQEFRDEFRLQLGRDKDQQLLIDRQKIAAERELRYWLSRLFTKKERYILDRMLDDLPISKTDYEYFSRKTRKKLRAILFLEDFARVLSEKTPRYDEDLFELRGLLEKILETQESEKRVSVEKFFIWKDDKVSINFTFKVDGQSQRKNTNIRLKDIKDDRTRSLLEKYQGHDFS